MPSPRAELIGLGGALPDPAQDEILFRWEHWARTAQLPPEGDWTTWLLMGGRGSGKTRAGAEWVRGLATGRDPVSPIAIVGRTLAEAQSVMLEGPGGLLGVHPHRQTPIVRGHKLIWPNGVVGELLSASEPDRFRGPQFAAAWCDEVAKWPDAEAAWDMLQFALRLGDKPRQLATTTPRPVPLIKRLLADERTVVTRMRTAENRAHLADSFLDAVVGRYRGTTLGRQELDGELIEDRDDALWTRGMFRHSSATEFDRLVVAVDPPVSANGRSDACGIVACGRVGRTFHVLADYSISPAPPRRWAMRAVSAFNTLDANLIVAEVNQGGDLVKQVIANEDADVPVKAVRANRGKWLRAEPVAMLYEQGRVFHRSGLAELEDEMCALTPDGLANGRSPDRVDALVWAITELMGEVTRPRVRAV